MCTKKNNFSKVVGEIAGDLNSTLKNKDYNVLFANSPCNDLHEISITDDTLSGAQPVTRMIHNYKTIKSNELLETVNKMIEHYELENKYNTFANKVKRFFNKDNDKFSKYLKDKFKIKPSFE